MLLALTQWMNETLGWGWLRVFNYLTFRAVFAALTAFFIGLLLGPKLFVN